MEDSPHSTAGIRYWAISNRYAPLLVALLVAAVFFPTLDNLFQRWIIWDEGLAHGLPMMATFLYALYQSAPWPGHQQPIWLGRLTLAGVFTCSLLWFFVAWIRLELLAQLTLLGTLILLYAWLYSWRTLYQQRILFGLPLFAIPIWEFINDDLVSLSSLVVGKAVQLMGMPAIIDGNSIFIPYGHILIADGCSGIRYLIISLALGYLVALFNHYSTTRLLVALGLAAMIGLLVNWIRIFSLVMIGYQTEMQSSLMTNHEIFGWLLFCLLVFPAVYFAPRYYSEKSADNTVNLTVTKSPWPVFIAIAIGPVLYYLPHQVPATAGLTTVFTATIQPVAKADMPLEVTAPEATRQEQGKIGRLYVQVHQYQRHQASDKLVPYLPRLYEHELWSSVQETILHLPEGSATLSELRHKQRYQRVLQLQWFNLMGYNTRHKTLAKILQIPAIMRGENLFSIYTLQILCVTDLCDDERKQLMDIAHQLPSYIHP